MKTIRIRNSACAAALALATIPATLFADYAKSFDISFPGYKESETLTNFPVLVRLSAARNDFKYAKCKLANGGDVRFFDADGTIVLPSEVDTWNPDGESLVWVRVPRLCEGTNIVCRYGNANPDPVTASDVWSEGYVGVWHLKEDKLPLADSSATSADFTRSATAAPIRATAPTALSARRSICASRTKVVKTPRTMAASAPRTTTRLTASRPSRLKCGRSRTGSTT